MVAGGHHFVGDAFEAEEAVGVDGVALGVGLVVGTAEESGEQGSDAAEQSAASAAEAADEEQREGDGADAEYQHEGPQHTL